MYDMVSLGVMLTKDNGWNIKIAKYGVNKTYLFYLRPDNVCKNTTLVIQT